MHQEGNKICNFHSITFLELIVLTVGKIPWDFGIFALSGMERMYAGGGSVFYPHVGNTGRYLGLEGKRHYK